MANTHYTNTALTADMLGDKVPRRHGNISKRLAGWFYRWCGWKTVGQLPNISQAVLIGVPHTSNIDGLYAIPMVIGLDLDVRIMGKKELFAVPVLSQFLRWAGVIPLIGTKKARCYKQTLTALTLANRYFWHLPQKALVVIRKVGRQVFIIWRGKQACPSFLWRWIMPPKKSVL